MTSPQELQHDGSYIQARKMQSLLSEGTKKRIKCHLPSSRTIELIQKPHLRLELQGINLYARQDLLQTWLGVMLRMEVLIEILESKSTCHLKPGSFK